MADIKMPESIPCCFDARGWAPCKKPSTNGWCSKHEKAKCVSCGKHATQRCDAQMGGLGCGADLCDDCGHSYAEGVMHVAKVVDEARREKEREERKARIASRNSPVQRMNEEFGVPATLFELLKGDWRKEYDIVQVYYLELLHGLMAFFPAVFTASDRRIVVTPDLLLLKSVWETLKPREAKIVSQLAYVNKARSIAYLETTTPEEREDEVPLRLLTVEEHKRLVRAEQKPFQWAFGLIGGRHVTKEEFFKMFARDAATHDPSFSRAA